MYRKKMYWCYDNCNGEICNEYGTDDKKSAYEFFRTAEDPMVIYGLIIHNLNDFREIEDETEIKTQ